MQVTFTTVIFSELEKVASAIINLARLAGDLPFSYKKKTLFCFDRSRHSLLTGRYPFRDGLQHLGLQDRQAFCSPLENAFLPELLRDHGYATHFIGSWNLGFCLEECLPYMRGFDTFYGTYNQGILFNVVDLPLD